MGPMSKNVCVYVKKKKKKKKKLTPLDGTAEYRNIF